MKNNLGRFSTLFCGMPTMCSGLLAVVAAGVLAGCATPPGQEGGQQPTTTTAYKNPQDPWEPFNRAMFRFNTDLDEAIIQPAAKGYRAITPDFARTGVSNFFNNLREPWYFVNNLLQFKGRAAFESVVRFTTNTVFGLGGVIDIASDMQIPRHKQDLGLTLAHWGMQPGPYLVLPILGPSTFRDTLALPVDGLADPVWYVHDIPWRNTMVVLEPLNTRAQYLDAGDVLQGAALDLYSFTRDAYLQRRAAQRPDDGMMEEYENYDDTPAPPVPGPGSAPQPSPVN